MKFEEVLPYIKQGRKAFRKGEIGFQSNYRYIDKERYEIMIKYDNSDHGVPSFFDLHDILAEDWELI